MAELQAEEEAEAAEILAKAEAEAARKALEERLVWTHPRSHRPARYPGTTYSFEADETTPESLEDRQAFAERRAHYQQIRGPSATTERETLEPKPNPMRPQ